MAKSKNKILQIGAEAQIIQKGKQVIKNRIPKSYRLPFIDEKIRRQRTKSEGKLLQKAASLGLAPSVEFIDENKKQISLDFIPGKRLSDSLDSMPLEKQKKICKTIGQSVAALHDSTIIHGDLTTSNMMSIKDKVLFIDFGLGFISHRNEDKAVDLHVLRQALEAKHFKHFSTLFAQVLQGYRKSKDAKKTLEQFKKVEARGRYKEQY